jgi:hypothetical protein
LCLAKLFFRKGGTKTFPEPGWCHITEIPVKSPVEFKVSLGYIEKLSQKEKKSEYISISFTRNVKGNSSNCNINE